VVDTYGNTPDQIESLVKVLFGELNPTGRLPVAIPGADGTGELYEFGHGLGY
jgi:beta-N-acetylhexosaminidase